MNEIEIKLAAQDVAAKIGEEREKCINAYSSEYRSEIKNLVRIIDDYANEQYERRREEICANIRK